MNENDNHCDNGSNNGDKNNNSNSNSRNASESQRSGSNSRQSRSRRVMSIQKTNQMTLNKIKFYGMTLRQASALAHGYCSCCLVHTVPLISTLRFPQLSPWIPMQFKSLRKVGNLVINPYGKRKFSRIAHSGWIISNLSFQQFFMRTHECTLFLEMKSKDEGCQQCNRQRLKFSK
jgi:hypothetical protein